MNKNTLTALTLGTLLLGSTINSLGQFPRIGRSYETPSVQEFKQDPERALRTMKLGGITAPEISWEPITTEDGQEIIKLVPTYSQRTYSATIADEEKVRESIWRAEWTEGAVMDAPGREFYLIPTEAQREYEITDADAEEVLNLVEAILTKGQLPSTLFGKKVEVTQETEHGNRYKRLVTHLVVPNGDFQRIYKILATAVKQGKQIENWPLTWESRVAEYDEVFPLYGKIHMGRTNISNEVTVTLEKLPNEPIKVTIGYVDRS